MKNVCFRGVLGCVVEVPGAVASLEWWSTSSQGGGWWGSSASFEEWVFSTFSLSGDEFSFLSVGCSSNAGFPCLLISPGVWWWCLKMNSDELVTVWVALVHLRRPHWLSRALPRLSEPRAQSLVHFAVCILARHQIPPTIAPHVPSLLKGCREWRWKRYKQNCRRHGCFKKTFSVRLRGFLTLYPVC